MKKNMKKLSKLMIVTTILLSLNGCATYYVNNKSQKEVATARKEQIAEDIKNGVRAPAYEEPTFKDGFNNDKAGNIIAMIVDGVAGYFIYDNVIADSSSGGGGDNSKPDGNSNDQNLTLNITGDSNIVSVSSTASSSATDTQNNSSNNDNRNF